MVAAKIHAKSTSFCWHGRGTPWLRLHFAAAAGALKALDTNLAIWGSEGPSIAINHWPRVTLLGPDIAWVGDTPREESLMSIMGNLFGENVGIFEPMFVGNVGCNIDSY